MIMTAKWRKTKKRKRQSEGTVPMQAAEDLSCFVFYHYSKVIVKENV